MPVVASHCVKRAWRATPAAADRGAAAGGIDRDGGGGGRGGGAPARRAVPGREARRLFSGGTRGRCVRCQAPARRRVAPAPRPLAPHDRAATVRTSPTHSQNRSDGRGGTSQRPEPLSVAEMPAPMRMRPTRRRRRQLLRRRPRRRGGGTPLPSLPSQNRCRGILQRHRPSWQPVLQTKPARTNRSYQRKQHRMSIKTGRSVIKFRQFQGKMCRLLSMWDQFEVQ